jgi:hypothetical protein
MTGLPRWRVLVDENYHYKDPESRWELGVFDTAEEALSECRRMVDDDLREFHRPGMSADALLTAYQALGDDPFVVPIDGAAAVDFSAWAYAEQRCAIICG